MNPKTQGTLACVATSIVFGGFIGCEIFSEVWMRILFVTYFAVLGLGTALVVSWDKSEGVTKDYFGYVFYGSLSFAILDVVLLAWKRGFPPQGHPMLLVMLFGLGAMLGLAYRFAALRALKSSLSHNKSKVHETQTMRRSD